MKNKFSDNIDIKNYVISQFNLDSLKKISSIRKENKFVYNLRLKGFEYWKTSQQPNWCNFEYNIDYNKITPYSEISKNNNKNNINKIKKLLSKIGVEKSEIDRLSQKKTKVLKDIVIDSKSFSINQSNELKKLGIIFTTISNAIKNFPRLIEKYLGSVIKYNYHYFAALNTAFFSDGTFIYVPKNVKCPIFLSTYFRINNYLNAQMERTLIIADENSEISYLEGCSAPASISTQLHCACVELIAEKNSKINYYTLQNWDRGEENKSNGVYNFVTKLAKVNENAEVNWVQFELGSKITWKYPSSILSEKNAKSNFFSLSIGVQDMIVDSGTKMIHLADNTYSSIISKTLSFDKSINTFRSKIFFDKNIKNCSNISKCDNIILSKNAKNNFFLSLDDKSQHSKVNYESCTRKIDEKKIIYLKSKGFNYNQIFKILIHKFTSDIINIMPNEFFLEAKELTRLIIDKYDLEKILLLEE